MVRVKICGITNLDDALHAAKCGANALGFVFYRESPRYIDPGVAGRIIRALPPFFTPVGVFVHAKPDEVREAVKISGVRIIQLHGGEHPDYCASFDVPFIKSVRVRSLESLREIEACPAASAYLLDSYSEKEFGGTGQTFNWDVAADAKRFGRIILSGGLTPDNVGDAIHRVRPYAVDVSSGVEASKGKKDPDKVRDFINRATMVGPMP